MQDLALVDHAALSPGVCGFCRTHEGPFVDTKNTLVPNARFICVKTCAHQIASLTGFASPESVAELEELVESQQAHIRTVEAQLETAGQDVDRLAEGIAAKVYDLNAEREKRRPPVETVA